jgi:hypothetical protein
MNMLFEDINEQDKANMTSLLRDTGSDDPTVSGPSQKAFAAALQTPLKQGILTGDIINGIFTVTQFDPNARVEYPIDFFRPDNASQFVAYTIPNQGKIPQKHVEGDYVTVPTFDVGLSIDFLKKYAKNARWDIVSRAMEVLEAGFVKKMNDDCWHTLLSAGFDRSLLTHDSNASAGQFTKRLVSAMKLVMRRNAGGNSTSLNRGKLTHLYVSPEALEDVRNWGVDEVDEITRREIYIANDGSYNKIFNVMLVDLDELGEGQEYQEYYETVPAAGASNNGMASGDVELVVGLDLSKNDSFVMPVGEAVQITNDPTLDRERRIGYYGTGNYGVGVLNNLRILLGSI